MSTSAALNHLLYLLGKVLLARSFLKGSCDFWEEKTMVDFEHDSSGVLGA